MALGNVFASFGHDQRHSLWQILSFETQKQDLLASLALEEIDAPLFEKMDLFTAISEDYESFRLSAQGHPMQALRQIKRLPRLTSQKAKLYAPKSHIVISGLLLLRQKPPTAKGVAFSTLEDEFGFMDLILHPRIYEKLCDVFLHECFVIVEGILQKEGNASSLLVQDMKPIWSEASEAGEKPLTIEPDQYFW
jgi:error-prone DNA polymerase